MSQGLGLRKFPCLVLPLSLFTLYNAYVFAAELVRSQAKRKQIRWAPTETGEKRDAQVGKTYC